MCKGTENANLHSLLVDKDEPQYCRFHYPYDESHMTYIKYNKVSNIAGAQFRTEAAAERNVPRFNRHPQLQLQRWRANIDIQLIIDQYAYIKYLPKYAPKTEKISSMPGEAFGDVMNNAPRATAPESAIRQLMLRCAEERDIGVQEINIGF